MGYVLPVRPIQSQQYANRMTMDSYDFASVGSVDAVKLNTDFQEEIGETYRSMEDEKSSRQERASSENTSSPPYKAYIPPNPANLSPAVSRVVGKGMSVNTYV